jgi:hypothetical protein
MSWLSMDCGEVKNCIHLLWEDFTRNGPTNVVRDIGDTTRLETIL